MPRGLLERLRGARGVEILLALALVALIALALMRIGGSGGGGSGGTELEVRVERILSAIDGVGRVRAMIAQDAEGNATGALIVADDLSDVATYLSLQSAVTTLLELDSSKVEIIGNSECFGGME